MRKLKLIGLSALLGVSLWGAFSSTGEFRNALADTEAGAQVTEATQAGDVTQATEATTPATEATTEDVSYVESVNSDRMSDYKISEDTFKEQAKSLAPNSVRLFSENSDLRDLDDLTLAKSYLIENDILQRHEVITFSSFSANVNRIKAELDREAENSDADETMYQSDLWIALYKAVYGVLPSRTVVYQHENDYIFYNTANVYEAYFEQLLNKGLITKNVFNSGWGEDFITEYERASKSNKSAYWDKRNGSFTLGNDQYFGKMYTLTSNTITSADAPKYLKDEQIEYLDALSIIAEFMHNTEKEMTAQEANIVTYKYGVQHLKGLSESDKSIVSFLIAKGILNPAEDNSDLANYYGEFSKSMAYTLLYRVANKDARYDFSEITLTDQESYWQQEGYGEDNISVEEVDNVPDVRTLTPTELSNLEKEGDVTVSTSSETSDDDVDDSEENNDVDEENFLDTIIGSIKSAGSSIASIFKGTSDGVVLEAQAATSKKYYKVTKLFDTKTSYYYDGKLVSTLKKTDADVHKVVTVKVNNGNGKKVSMIAVTFKIKSKSSATATKCVDSKITIDASTKSSSTVVGLTKILDEDGNEITLIPQEKLKDSFSDISVIEDKVLLNTKTGMQAVLLPDAGYALVGNRVIVSDTLIEFDSGNAVYYNLEVITSLMSNAYLKTLSYNKSIYHCPSMIGETLVEVESSTGSTIQKTYKSTFKFKVSGETKKVTMINQDSLTKGINSLSRKFTVKNTSGKDTDVYVVVDWTFVVPKADELTDLLETSITGKTATLNDVNDIIYTRPEGSEVLCEWWDSNISMSNALCNFMYGTKGVEYVKSGYMAPSLTILKGSNVTDAVISTMFSKNGFQISSTLMQYLNSSNTSVWWKSYFSGKYMKSEYGKALATHRVYKKLTGKKASGGSYYGKKYFVTLAGTIYHDVDSDSRLSWKTDSKKVLVIASRTEPSVSLGIGSLFTYNNESYVYLGTTDEGYIKILPNYDVSNYLSGYVTVSKASGTTLALLTTKYHKNNSMLLGTISSSNMIKNAKKFYKVKFPGTSIPSKYQKVNKLFGVSKSWTWNNGTEFFIYKNSVAQVSDSKITSYNRSKIASTVGQTKGYAVPYIFLNATDYCFVQDSATADDGSIQFKLEKGQQSTLFNFGNVYYSGINQTVMDSITAQYTSTIDLTELEVGQKVYFGDVLFVCKQNKSGEKVLNSTPIKNKSVAKSCKTSTGKKLKSAIKGIFKGQKISYSNKSYSLTSYIKDVGIGPLTGQGKIKLGILYKTNKTLKIKTNKKSSKDMKKSVEYLCIQIKCKKGLLVRPISSDGNTFTLLYSGTAAGNLALDNIPFFNEDLSYKNGGNSDLSTSHSAFSVSAFYNDAKNEFKEMMSDAFKGDVITLIWFLVFALASYLAIMSWVCFAILTHNVGKQYLEILTIPLQGVGRRGLDIVKIVTLGIYSIDSEPSFGRTVFTTFVCFFINYAVLIWFT